MRYLNHLFFASILTLALTGCTSSDVDEQAEDQPPAAASSDELTEPPVATPNVEQTAAVEVKDEQTRVDPPMPRVPGFNELVTKEVVVQGVKEFMHWSTPSYGVDVEAKVANYYAREGAYCTFITAEMVKQGMPMPQASYVCGATEWYWDWTDLTIEVARAKLKDPAQLWQVYRQFGPTVVKAIKGTDAQQPISEYLSEVVVPTFTKPVPNDDLMPLYQREAAAYEVEKLHWRNYKEGEDEARRAKEAGESAVYTYHQKEFEMLAKKDGFQDPYLLQWRLRRQAEGGDELVSMWAKIAMDLDRQLAPEANKK